jgi:hypothetical protein
LNKDVYNVTGGGTIPLTGWGLGSNLILSREVKDRHVKTDNLTNLAYLSAQDSAHGVDMFMFSGGNGHT